MLTPLRIPFRKEVRTSGSQQELNAIFTEVTHEISKYDVCNCLAQAGSTVSFDKGMQLISGSRQFSRLTSPFGILATGMQFKLAKK